MTDLKLDELVISRLDNNRAIVEILAALVEEYPSMRFGQILRNANVVQETLSDNLIVNGWENEFNTESVTTQERMMRSDLVKRILGTK